MKTILAAIFICGLCAFQAQAKPDIYARPALYVGGTIEKNNAVNKNAKYATPTAPLEVSKSGAIMQKDGYFQFYASYYLLIKAEKNLFDSMKFYNRIATGEKTDLSSQIKPKTDAENVAGYSNDTLIIVIRQFIWLKEGANDVTLTLDGGKTVDEADEANNAYKFKITLKN